MQWFDLVPFTTIAFANREFKCLLFFLMSFLLTKKVFIPDIFAEKWKNSSAVRMWLLVAACKDLLAASRFKVPPVPSYAPIDFFIP